MYSAMHTVDAGVELEECGESFDICQCSDDAADLESTTTNAPSPGTAERASQSPKQEPLDSLGALRTVKTATTRKKAQDGIAPHGDARGLYVHAAA